MALNNVCSLFRFFVKVSSTTRFKKTFFQLQNIMFRKDDIFVHYRKFSYFSYFSYILVFFEPYQNVRKKFFFGYILERITLMLREFWRILPKTFIAFKNSFKIRIRILKESCNYV